MTWAILRKDAASEIAAYERALKLRSAPPEQLAKETGATLEQVAEALAIASGAFEVAGPGLEVFDGVAHISIRGVLLAESDPILALFGVDFSDYASISEQVQAAESDDRVSSMVLHVNSPGGLVEGMFAAADVIAAADKPITAMVSNVAASAAYFLASQADRIEATNRSDRFGSVGVAVDIEVDSDVVSIASTNAPNKRPDLSTEEGREVVRAQLDQAEALFIEQIARGRRVSVEAVQQNFGRGGILLAGLAIDAGMIDAIAEGNDMPPTDTQVSGVRAALGLSKDTDREELIAFTIETKRKADAHDEMVAKLEQAEALTAAAKDQLGKAQAKVAELEARDSEREEQAFQARRTEVINKALADNKITPAQVEQYTAIAKDKDGLKQLVELFAVTAPLGLTEVNKDAQSPKGKTKLDPENEEHVKQYAAAYGLTPPEAKRILAKRKGNSQ